MGVGRQAGRQIDGHDGHAERVDVGGHCLQHAVQRLGQPGPEDRVDEEVELCDLWAVELPRLLVWHLDDLETELAQDVQVQARVASHLGHAGEDKDRDVDAALFQGSRHDEPIATVVPASAQHHDPKAGQVVERGLDGGDDLAPGIFHEHRRGDAQLLDRASIGFLHLRGGQDAHRSCVLCFTLQYICSAGLSATSVAQGFSPAWARPQAAPTNWATEEFTVRAFRRSLHEV